MHVAHLSEVLSVAALAVAGVADWRAIAKFSLTDSLNKAPQCHAETCCSMLMKLTQGLNVLGEELLLLDLDPLIAVHDMLVRKTALEPADWSESCNNCSIEEIDARCPAYQTGAQSVRSDAVAPERTWAPDCKTNILIVCNPNVGMQGRLSASDTIGSERSAAAPTSGGRKVKISAVLDQRSETE
eukprot:5826795-Amphidinium_carterae.1